ncbi:MAG: phage tail tape measure protein [Bacillota bacterium]
MSDDLKILISAGLNIGQSVGEINTAIKSLGKHPHLQKLNIKVNVDESFIKSINGFIAATNKLNIALQTQNKVVNETTTEFRELDGSVKKVTQQILQSGEIINKTKTVHDANKKAIQSESNAYENQRKTIKQLERELSDYSLTKQKVTKNSNGQTEYNRTYKNDEGNILSVRTDQNGYVKKYDEINDFLKRQQDAANQEQIINKQREQVAKEEYNVRKSLEDRKLKEHTQHVKQIESIDRAHYLALKTDREKKESLEKTHILALQQNARREQEYVNSVANMQVRINNAQKGLKTDSATYTTLSKLSNSLNNVSNIGDFKSKLANISTEYKKITSNATQAEKVTMSFGQSLGTAMQKFPVWMAATTAFYAPIRAFQNGIQYIYDLDTAMTNLQKVTDNTSSEYQQFLYDAQNAANSIGGLTLDVVKSTTEWARLGYTINQAKVLAKETLIYQNVGDIDSAEQASEALIATIKGFGVEVDAEGKNIANIVDIYNEVGNKFAISSQGIGDAMKRSAASLSVAGNTIEESVAMITAANTTVQDPAKVGNALKTIAMRLRGVSEEGEDLTNLMPSLEEKFSSVGLTLKKNDNTFKSTYEIFEDLSTVWDKLSDFQQAEFVELIAGKHQGNIAASMISNWKDAQGSLEAGLNSFGSAARENEKYLESMQGRIALFKNAVNSFWSDSISTEFLKLFIDAGTKMIKMIDNLGNAVGLVVGIFLTFRYKAIAGLITGLASSVTSLFTTKAAIAATGRAANTTAVALTGMQRALGIFGLIITAGSIAYTIFNQIINQTNAKLEKNNQLIEESQQKYEKLRGELENTSSYYKQNHELVSEDSSVKEQLFQMQNQLIDTYGKEAEGIDLVNGKYDEQIKKLEELNSVNLDNQIKDTQILVNALNEQKYSSPNLGNGGFHMWFGKGEQSYSINDGGGFGDLNLKDYYEELLVLQDKIRNNDKTIFASEKLIPKNWEEWNNALKKVQSKLNELSPQYNELNKLEALKKQKIEATFLSQKKFNEEQEKLFKSVSAAISKQPLNEYENSLKEISSIIKSFDGTNLESVLDKVKNISSISIDSTLLSNLENLKQKVSDVSDGFSSLANIDYFKKLGPQIENSKKDIQLLNTAQKELKETNHLSVETINKMNSSYSDFIKVAGQSKEEVSKFIETKKEEKQVFIDTEKEKTKVMADAIRMQLVAFRIANDLSLTPLPVSIFEIAETRLRELEERLGILDNFGTDLKYTADELNREQKKSNETISETNELLTEQQKRLRDVELAMEKLLSKRNRYKKGSKQHLESIKEEIKLLKEQKKIYEDGVKNPETLLSTKVTTNTNLPSGESYGGTSYSNSNVSELISTALGLQGKFKYDQVPGEYKGSFEQFVKGATSDCSQFVQEMFKEFLDIELPRTAAEQAKQGAEVKKSDLKPGDLVFFNTVDGKPNSHAGIYTGNGKFIQMGNSGLSEQDLYNSYWLPRYNTARRVVSGNETSASVPSSSKAYSGKYADSINSSASKHGVDPNLIAAVIQQESSFGANGITNVMQVNGMNGATVAASIDAGTKMLKELLAKAGGDVKMALGGYNMGSGIINEFKKNGGYSRDIMKAYSDKYNPKYPGKVYGDIDYVEKISKNYSGNRAGSGDQKVKYTPPSESDKEQARIDAQKKVNKYEDDIYKAEIYYIESAISVFDNKIENFERLIEKSEMKQTKNPETSKEWRKEEMSQISYLTKQQEELHNQNVMLDKLIAEKKITSGEFDKRKADNSMKWLKLEEEKQKKKYDLLISSLDQYEQKREKLSYDLEQSEARSQLLDTASPAYRKELEKQISLKKLILKQDEAEIKAIKEKLKNTKLLPIEKEDLKNRLESVEAHKVSVEIDISDTHNEMIDSYLEGFSDKIKAKDDELRALQDNLLFLEKGTPEYTKELMKQIPLIQDKIKLNKDEIAYLESQIKRTNISVAERKKLNLLLVEANELNRQFLQDTRSIQEEIVNSIIDGYKKAIEQRRDLEISAIEDQMKLEDERHEKVIKDLDEEFSKFEKYINAQIKAMDRQNASDDYEKELNKKLKERQEIMDKINVLSLDNSMEAKAKRKDLQDQLDSKNEEIDEFKLQKERELRKQGLQDQLDDRKEYNDQIRKDEDKQYDDFKKKNDKEKKDIERKYKDMLEDEKNFYRLKQGLLSENKAVVKSTVDEIKKYYLDLYGELEKALITHKTVTQREYDNIKNIFDNNTGNLNNYYDGKNNNGSGSGSGSGSNSGNSAKLQAWEEYLKNKQKAERLASEAIKLQREKPPDTKAIKKRQDEIARLKDINEGYRTQYSFPDGRHDALKDIVMSAETGGMTPAWGKEGKFLLAHEKELVLNKSDTSNLLKMVDITRGIVQSLKSNFNFDIAKSKQPPSTTDNSITIEKVEIIANDKETGSSLLQKFEGALNAKLKYRTI